MASPFRGTGAPGYALGGTPSSPMLEQDSRITSLHQGIGMALRRSNDGHDTATIDRDWK